MEGLMSGFGDIMNVYILLILTLGTVIGIIFGAIPGLTATTGVSLFLPFTFGSTPTLGLALLIGVWIGGISGGLIAASLIGIPGTPSSIATCFDGYPLTLKGQPAKSLGTGIVASFIGTTVSVFIAALISPIIADMALQFGPWEYFSLGVAAMMMVSTLSKDNMFKGLGAAFMGLFFASVGMSPIDGNPRFTFDTVELSAGLNLLALVLGVFAIKQILTDFGKDEKIPVTNITAFGFGITLQEVKKNLWNITRSFLIGLWIGFLPGIGSGLSNLVAYAQAKAGSKHPEKFGTGIVDGIWASETSNNAAVGGAAIPMLTLGIPGDSVTAILLGALMIHGLQPGPLLFTQNPEIVHLIFALILMSGIITFVLQYIGMPTFSLILKIPPHYMWSTLIVMSFVGAYASNNYFFSVWLMIFFAVVSLLCDVGGVPITPMILGFILGPMIETNLRRGMTWGSGDFSLFFTRPISGVLIAIAIFSFIWPIVKARRDREKTKAI